MSFLVKEQPFVIAIDFDNTICIPTTGIENPSGYKLNHHIEDFLSNLYSNYHCNFFLYTSRSGQLYNYALDFLIEHSLDKYFILPDSPEYRASVPFVSGHKLYADFYLDDLAVGAPLIHYHTSSFITGNTSVPVQLNPYLTDSATYLSDYPYPGTSASSYTAATPFNDYLNLFQAEYAIISKITSFCLANNIELPKR